MSKTKLDYIQDELKSISSRLSEYTEYGYSCELNELVEAMTEFRNKLTSLESKEIKELYNL